MQPVVYRRRRNALSRSEREWRVEEDALVAVGSSGAEKRFAWADMLSVRLRREPARFRRWRYVLELQPRKGGKLVIDNASYVAPGQYEERSETYRAFAHAVVARLAAVRPEMRALIGETPRRYFFLLLAALLGLGAFAFALIAIPTPIDDLEYAGLFKLAIVSLMLPIFWGWVLRAMPRGVPLAEIPERALPPASA